MYSISVINVYLTIFFTWITNIVNQKIADNVKEKYRHSYNTSMPNIDM